MTDGKLTARQAADMLNVSYPYMLGLLAVGEVPSTRSAGQFRVNLADLMRYQDEDDARRRAASDGLTQLSQDQ